MQSNMYWQLHSQASNFKKHILPLLLHPGTLADLITSKIVKHITHKELKSKGTKELQTALHNNLAITHTEGKPFSGSVMQDLGSSIELTEKVDQKPVCKTIIYNVMPAILKGKAKSETTELSCPPFKNVHINKIKYLIDNKS